MLAHHKAGHNGRTGVPAVPRVVKIRQECVGVNAWVVSMRKQSVQVFLLNIKHARSQPVRNGSNGVSGILALSHVAMERVGGNVNVPNLGEISVLDRRHRQKSVHQDHVAVDGISGQNGVNVQFRVVVVYRHDQEFAWVDKLEEEIVLVMQERKSELNSNSLICKLKYANSYIYSGV